jgi:hypothetical protein
VKVNGGAEVLIAGYRLSLSQENNRSRHFATPDSVGFESYKAMNFPDPLCGLHVRPWIDHYFGNVLLFIPPYLSLIAVSTLTSSSE